MHGEAPHMGLVDDAVLHGQAQGPVSLPVKGRSSAGQHTSPLGPCPGRAQWAIVADILPHGSGWSGLAQIA